MHLPRLPMSSLAHTRELIYTSCRDPQIHKFQHLLVRAPEIPTYKRSSHHLFRLPRCSHAYSFTRSSEVFIHTYSGVHFSRLSKSLSYCWNTQICRVYSCFYVFIRVRAHRWFPITAGIHGWRQQDNAVAVTSSNMWRIGWKCSVLDSLARWYSYSEQLCTKSRTQIIFKCFSPAHVLVLLLSWGPLLMRPPCGIEWTTAPIVEEA